MIVNKEEKSIGFPEWVEIPCPNVETFNFVVAIGEKYGYKWYDDKNYYIKDLPINITIDKHQLILHFNPYNEEPFSTISNNDDIDDDNIDNDDDIDIELITLDRLEETIKEFSNKIKNITKTDILAKKVINIQLYTRKCPVCKKNLITHDNWSASGHLHNNAFSGYRESSYETIIMCSCSCHIKEIFDNPKKYFNYNNENVNMGYLGEWSQDLGIMAVINYGDDSVDLRDIT